jgi:hypothetical protein
VLVSRLQELLVVSAVSSRAKAFLPLCVPHILGTKQWEHARRVIELCAADPFAVILVPQALAQSVTLLWTACRSREQLLAAHTLTELTLRWVASLELQFVHAAGAMLLHGETCALGVLVAVRGHSPIAAASLCALAVHALRQHDTTLAIELLVQVKWMLCWTNCSNMLLLFKC